jgi:hypothetical protein
MTKYSITETWNNLSVFGRLLIGFVSLFLILCTVGSCFSTVLVILLPVPTITSQAAPTLTISPSPDIYPDFTPLASPSLTPFPTRRAYASLTPPIYLVTPTSTINPFPIASITPTSTLYPRNKEVCPCTSDKTLTCSDFPNHKRAQACYDFCYRQGAGDIHHLDEDGNGIACEGLP